MITIVGSSLGDSQSTNRPTMFNGTNCNYWKFRMRIYIQSVSYELWRIIVNGPKVPTMTIERVVLRALHLRSWGREWLRLHLLCRSPETSSPYILYGCSLSEMSKVLGFALQCMNVYIFLPLDRCQSLRRSALDHWPNDHQRKEDCCIDLKFVCNVYNESRGRNLYNTLSCNALRSRGRVEQTLYYPSFRRRTFFGDLSGKPETYSDLTLLCAIGLSM